MKHKHSHEKGHDAHETHESNDATDNNVWKYAAVVLGVLLVVSVFTNGFRFTSNLDSVIKELNSLNSKQSSPDVKSALSSAVASLEKANTALKNAQPSNTGQPGN